MSTVTWTADWGRAFRANAGKWLSPLRGRPCVYLEVGVFEGRSGHWMLTHVLTHPQSRYVGIDTWAGSSRLQAAHERAHQNLSPFRSRVRLVRERAQTCLARPDFEPCIDVAYSDGDHRTEAVVEISRLLWPRLGHEGIVIWDDLPWGEGQVGVGVERFLDSISGEYDVLFRNWQLGVRKLAPRRD